MPRLPQPGSDEGTWGNVLNEYLSQALAADGTIKPDSVGPSQLADNAVTASAIAPGAISNADVQDGTISEAKLAPAVQTKLNATAGATDLASTATTTTITVTSSTGNDAVLAAATTSLAGVMSSADKAKLNGIATAATANASDAQLRDRSTHTGTQAISTVTGLQTSLNEKAASADLADVATSGDYTDLNNVPTTFAPTAHGHTASDITSGTIDIARIPTGASNTTVAIGDHVHANYLADKNSTVALTDSTADRFTRVNITNDGTATSGWSDRLAFYFDGTRSGYFNEYGELRARPARSNTIAFRTQKWAGSSTVDIFQVTSSDNATLYFTVGPNSISASVPINTTANISTTGTVAGSNIGNKVTASSTAPSNPSVGDVWVDLST